MMKKKIMQSIKSKITVLLCVSSIIPLLIMGIYASRLGSDAINREAAYASQIAVRTTASNIELHVYQLITYASFIANDKTILEVVQGRKAGAYEQKMLLEEMKIAQSQATVPFRAMIIPSGGGVYYDFPWAESHVRAVADTIRGEEWFPREKSFVREMQFLGCRESYLDGLGSKLHYYFYTNLTDAKGTVHGILLIDVDSYTFDKLLLVSADAGKNTLLITDADQVVISPSRHAGAALDFFAGEKKETVLLQNGLQVLSWNIALSQNRISLYRDMMNIWKMLLLLIGLILASECFVYRFFDKTLTRPLIALKNMVESAAEVDFAIHCPARSEDEIGQLTRGINSMAVKIQDSLRAVKQEEKKAEKFRFMMLQAQINPHFLYNTLNSLIIVANFMHCENISDALSSLIRLLRYSIDNYDNKITVKEEITYLQDYVALNNLRYKNRIKFLVDIDEGILQELVIKFLHQPILENAILHGFQEKIGVGTIRMQMKEEEGYIISVIEDDGMGIAPEILENIYTSRPRGESEKVHIGISNIAERIQLVYGADCCLVVESSPGAGTKVTMRLHRERDRMGAGNENIDHR